MTQHDSARTQENTASVAYLKALFDYTKAHGLQADSVLAGHALALDDRDARLPESVCAGFFDHAAELLRDPALGLHVGETIRPGHYGVLGYVAMNCGTLGEALARLNRYQALVLDIGPMQLSATVEAVRLSWNPDSARPYRQLAEFNLCGLVTFARWISGQHDNPWQIEFNYPAPDDLGEHRRIFGCELLFDQPCYAITLPSQWLSQPLLQPDPSMRSLMLRLAEKQMLGLARSDDPLTRARGLIAQRLSEGDLTLAQLARQLEMNPRTLQRRLKDEGLGYTQLVDSVRRQLAERYLADSELDLNDLAYLLGFSEQSAFQRAFKRWMGQSPGAWRRQNKQHDIGLKSGEG